MQQIQIDKNSVLDKLKYYQAQTLFEPDLGLIKEGYCPLCMRRLKNIKGKILLCDSKKHVQKFIKKI